MSDLISRSELLKYSRRVVEYDEAGYSITFNAVSVEDIKNAPTVEAVPVVHGEWEIGGVQGNMIGNFKCSVCKGVSLKDSNFCPNCGARMNGV